ncbi:hypothetical protein LA6_001612 [Marinibacterium anthonyi]|nr:hypothetical protein LA6_001612 [Marinibacterium anthonyi]
MSATVTLAPRLDSAAAELLTEELKSARGSALCVDAGAVTFCGSLALQTLLSAKLQWQEDEHSFEISAPSRDLSDACRLLGISPQEIGIKQEMGEPQ